MIERPRDVALERQLTRMAHQAAGVAVPMDEREPTHLDAYADYRAQPGGVRVPRQFIQEAREELADARNYLVWEACAHHAGYMAGDPESCARFEHAMRVLGKVCEAWRELHTLPG